MWNPFRRRKADADKAPLKASLPESKPDQELDFKELAARVRYQLDFMEVPRGFEEDKAFFLGRILQDKELRMMSYFNAVYALAGLGNKRRYERNDFRVTLHDAPNDQHIVYVELPSEIGSKHMYCTAYAFTYRETTLGEKTDMRFFTVELSPMDTTCIGTMTASGNHYNFGKAFSSVEENVERIRSIIG